MTVNLHSFYSSDVHEEDGNSDMRSSASSSSQNEDFFQDLNIDECLLQEKLCL
jgi:hypothetical protein